jgi:acyl-CoA thioesterase
MDAYAPLDQHLKKRILAAANDRIRFWSLIGMQIEDVRKGWALVRVPFGPELTNAAGRMHGGVIFSAADSATGVALLGLLEEGERIATLEMKINYLKPVFAEDIIAEARIVHRGQQTAVGDVDVRDGSGSQVAKSLSTYAIWFD